MSIIFHNNELSKKDKKKKEKYVWVGNVQISNALNFWVQLFGSVLQFSVNSEQNSTKLNVRSNLNPRKRTLPKEKIRQLNLRKI